jgi:hypothetical protein
MLLVDPAGFGRVQAAPAVVVALMIPPAAPPLPPAKHTVVVGQLTEKYQALVLPS